MRQHPRDIQLSHQRWCRRGDISLDSREINAEPTLCVFPAALHGEAAGAKKIVHHRISELETVFRVNTLTGAELDPHPDTSDPNRLRTQAFHVNFHARCFPIPLRNVAELVQVKVSAQFTIDPR